DRRRRHGSFFELVRGERDDLEGADRVPVRRPVDLAEPDQPIGDPGDAAAGSRFVGGVRDDRIAMVRPPGTGQPVGEVEVERAVAAAPGKEPPPAARAYD